MTNNRVILQPPDFSGGGSGYAEFEDLQANLKCGKYKCPCKTDAPRYIFIRRKGLYYAMCASCGKVMIEEKE